jgi:serine/threonine protein kinase/Tfp pilus assembly protein PilF
MQAQATNAAVCPECGTRLEGGFSRGLGRCMICLLRVGFDDAEEPDEAPLSSVADRLGNYRIERRDDGSLWELGRGAMGVTYRALDTSLRRAVALKLIDSEWVKRGAEARERFMREARTAASLRHPNVATVYHFGIREENGQCFCAMELVEGETLEMRVRRTGPLDALTTIDIALQVSSALAAAEKQGLVHRDLKPANLMFVAEAPDANDSSPGKAEKADTVVKVIDFGVAKALAEKPDAMGLTHGGFVGTPAFASPEQFTDARVDVRSDIYSLGATLWYLLTGHRPFQATTIEQIRASQHSQALPIEQLKAARVPSRLISLLASMLAAEPAARPDVRALTSQLQDCRAQMLDRWKAARRLALTAGLIGMAAAAFVLFLRWHNRAMSQNAAPANISKKGIAVLPFENLSDHQANANFAMGIQDEILTDLAKIADLKVISRTSVMQYKTRGERNLREIGQQLGVAHVLEGSVQRAGNRVRVNAQLINARTDAHLWAQTYDRDLADVFAIQSEIAKAIAGQLEAKLSPREENAIERPPTSDIPAFELYAQAKNVLAVRNARSNLLEAVDLLNQAVARDPSFFKAYCQLAHTHDRLYFLGYDHTPARLALAEAAIQAAFRLRPDAGEAHLARAQNLYRGYLEYDAALAELEVAGQTLPNDAGVFELKAYIQRRRGKQEEAVRSLERAIDIDPRNTFTLQQIALSYHHLRRFAEEKSVLDRALAIEPNDVDTKVARAFVEFHWKADTRPLHQILDSIRATNPGATQTIADGWLICALAERDAGAAINAAIAAGANPPFIDEAVNFSRPFVEGIIARVAKDDEKARSAFTAARAEQEKIIHAQPNYGPPLCVLGLIDAGLGRKEEALREGRRAVELLPVEKDAINGTAMIKYLAMIAAWVGDDDLACEQLAVAIRPPSRLTYGQLKLLPFWDPLRGDPRFEKIVASLAPK